MIIIKLKNKDSRTFKKIIVKLDVLYSTVTVK